MRIEGRVKGNALWESVFVEEWRPMNVVRKNAS